MHPNYTPKHAKQTNNDCPTCGWSFSKTGIFEQVMSGTFSGLDAAGYTATRTTPIRKPDLQSDVLVPAAQSLIWTVVVALPALSVSMFMRWEWAAPVFISAVTVLASWVSAMKRSENSQQKTEELTVSSSGKPSASETGYTNEPGVRLDIVHTGGDDIRRIEYAFLPKSVSSADFRKFCDEIVAGASLARRNWVGKGKIFSRDGYDQLIANLLENHIILAHHTGGKRLTERGRRTLTAMLEAGKK